MKKSNLIVGFIYLIAGLACLAVALNAGGKAAGLLFGLSGAGIGPGLVMICKYFYWTSPKNRERYQERLENERIELHDELKEKIRDKSGRYTYVLGIFVICISMVVFSVLDALEVIENAQLIVFYLGGYLVFQIAAGIIIFNRIIKKY